MSEQLAGLTAARAKQLLEQFGRNEIPEVDTPWWQLLGKQFVGVMPFMLEIAAIVSAVIPDWKDFGIIMAMLIINGLIGFHEEHKAKQSLDALKSQMTATVPTKRDGEMVILEVAELVPGDIIFLRGGNIVPADCEFIEGDEMQIDTAALTGEPIPRKVPRPDRDGEEPGKGKELLGGCIIRQGEGHCVVKKTGTDTEIGQAADLVQQSSGHQAGVFETKIMQVVKGVILVSLIDACVLLYVQMQVRGNSNFRKVLLDVLAIVIGAVPIALPLVMQVTMAIGAGVMASKQAIVTHLTALQEIASMTVLCSDKTGTLTTANMRVMPQSIWTKGDYSQEDALIWAGVASNPANKEDPIDGSVLKSCAEYFKGEAEAEAKMAPYKKTKFIGFNPTTKRTVVYCEHPQRGNLKLSKGLTSKVLCTGDDGGDCWEVKDLQHIRNEVQEVDVNFSIQGYKTLGVAIAEGDGPMNFAAVVPMLDPPREDTKETIYRIRQASIGVKMITGDHLNIAIETSRLIGLGTGILPASDLWPASHERDETIISADGFAQVLPKDKREVILVLQNRGLVVGMTGDGVNDAPALAQAQIGIAVDGATEAARSAADIILTTPGLSAIFDAVYHSRMIFARLRAYVLYRMAATIQIVVVLSILIYGYNVVMTPLYVILLALLNDISMIPIAQDNAAPSSSPEIPSMPQILLASTIYGVLLTVQSIGFFEYGLHSSWLDGKADPCTSSNCEYLSTCAYLQISIAIEFVILSCRAPGFILSPKYLLDPAVRPSVALLAGVMFANILVSVLAGVGTVIYQVEWVDIGFIWIYDIVGLLIIDIIKVALRFWQLPWMSAGAAYGVLEYSDMPEETGNRNSQLRSTLRSSVGRSVMRSNQASVAASGMMGSSVGGQRSQCEIKAPSMLPFPYNMRANASRNFRSF
jgi:H+-transporting ATPase